MSKRSLQFGLCMAAVGLCLLIVGVSLADESNVYWRVDLNQGSYVIGYGQGSTEDAAWQDCFRLRAITRAMTAAETRKGAVSAITTNAVRWCKNPMQLATVRPDPVVTPVNCVVSEWGAWSDPPWLACTAGGQQTRALIRNRTIVTQPANGGAACPSLVETRTETRTCAALSWTPPTQNTDGSALTNLAGYRIVYGASPTAMTQTAQVANTNAYVVTGVAPGTWYFAVKTYTTQGVESALSNIAQRTVQ